MTCVVERMALLEAMTSVRADYRHLAACIAFVHGRPHRHSPDIVPGLKRPSRSHRLPVGFRSTVRPAHGGPQIKVPL